MTISPIPRKAATVILLREESSPGFEVYLLKRSEKSAFMGGMFVYPGGVVDKDDLSTGALARYRGTLLLGAMTPEDLQSEISGHVMAAIRELFEEAGVLLAYDGTGRAVSMKDTRTKDRFSGYRHMLNDGQITFGRMAREERLLLETREFYLYARWVTPEARHMRFDTLFFVARSPEDQEAIPDGKETTEGLWISPAKALERHRSGGITLSPPTFKTLEDMARFPGIDALIGSLTGKEATTVLPVFIPGKEQETMVMPWDSEYELLRSGRIREVMKPGRPSTPADNTTRFLLRDGRVHPYVA
jgi:8-oxo-dGTP pyrophosphatase MutT (NUDIX family)